MKNATPAQTLRLTRIRKDIKDTGYRVTTRQLPGSLIQVTEYLGRTKAAVSVLGTDGNYIEAAPTKAAKLATKKTTKAATWTLNADIANRVALTLFNGMSTELQAEFVATLAPEELATLEAGLKRGRELRARAGR